MSIKKLGLALAVSTLASGANAALYVTGDDAGNTGGSSLLFVAYDAAAANTLYVDLNALQANNRVHTFDQNANQTINLAAVAAANNFSLANVQWTIVGGDSFFLGGTCTNANLAPCGQAYVATVAEGEALPATATSSSIQSTIGGVNNGWFLQVRGDINTGNGHSTTRADGTAGQFTDGLVTAQNFWGVTGTTGETLGFAMASFGGVSGRLAPAALPNGEFAMMAGSWTLGGDTVLSYSAVPVPAAVWMFASGLVGLAGVARRRKQA